jgi:hypothetical protein
MVSGMDDAEWVRVVEETAGNLDRLGVSITSGVDPAQEALSAAGVGRAREVVAMAVKARRGAPVVRPAKSMGTERARWTRQRDNARDRMSDARLVVAELEAADDWPAEVAACRGFLDALDLPAGHSLAEAQRALKDAHHFGVRGAVSEAAWGIGLGIDPVRPDGDVWAMRKKLAHARTSIDLWATRAEAYDQRLNDLLPTR